MAADLIDEKKLKQMCGSKDSSWVNVCILRWLQITFSKIVRVDFVGLCLGCGWGGLVCLGFGFDFVSYIRNEDESVRCDAGHSPRGRRTWVQERGSC